MSLYEKRLIPSLSVPVTSRPIFDLYVYVYIHIDICTYIYIHIQKHTCISYAHCIWSIISVGQKKKKTHTQEILVISYGSA